MEIQLNPNGWHRKLQKYVFSNPPTFNNFCPYFWITNFCILVVFIIPVVPLIRSIVWIFTKIGNGFEAIGDLLDKQYCQPALRKAVEKMSEEDVLKGYVLYFKDSYFDEEGNLLLTDKQRLILEDLKYNHLYHEIGIIKSKMREEYASKFEIWKNKTPNWQTVLEEYRIRKLEAMEKRNKNREKMRLLLQEEKNKKEASEYEAKKRNQAMFNNIVKYTKWLGYVVVAAIVAAVCYMIYIIADYAIAHFHYGNFIFIMKLIGWCLLSCASILLIIYFFRTLINKCCICICNCKVGSYLGRALEWFWIKILEPALSKIFGFLEFFWKYIMAVKKDYCPGIKWEDEKSKH